REGDVDRAVKAADRALYEGPWPKITATQRGKLLYKLADLVAANSQVLAELETRDTGIVAIVFGDISDLRRGFADDL
ncbi:aldehyde dehydrogenase family protein, partial [Rhizobium leguminosarum]|uniref:aldehyde dehydrogenase family protein n=1 Tax=Rhizobium leguminosarum TaxID=384 RepID=UPI003F9A9E88